MGDMTTTEGVLAWARDCEPAECDCPTLRTKVQQHVSALASDALVAARIVENERLRRALELSAQDDGCAGLDVVPLSFLRNAINAKPDASVTESCGMLGDS